jgi:uncharacterized protein YjbJ (UPF0337 family)
MSNAQEFQALWTSFLSRVKGKWKQLTDDDLVLLEGSVDRFIARVQEKTGQEREAVERALGSLSKRGSCGLDGAAPTSGASAQPGQWYSNGATDCSGPVLGKVKSETHEEANGTAQRTPADFGLGMVAGLLVATALRCTCGQDQSGAGLI